MTPEELAGKIRAGTGSEADRLALYNSIMPFCQKLAKRYEGLLRTSGEKEDLLQEAFLATQAAAEVYNPEQGASFITWAAFFIHRYYETYTGQQMGGSAHAAQMARKVRRCEADFMAIHGREPADAEICAALRITPETLQILRQRGKERSLDAEIEGRNGEGYTLADIISGGTDPEEVVLERIQREEVRGALRRFLDDLPQQERAAAYMFYVRGWTDKKSAKYMDTTPARFRQIRERALQKLQSSRNLRELGRYLPERLGSMLYRTPNRNAWQSSTEMTAIKALSLDTQIEAKALKAEVLDAINGYHHRKRNDTTSTENHSRD